MIEIGSNVTGFVSVGGSLGDTVNVLGMVLSVQMIAVWFLVVVGVLFGFVLYTKHWLLIVMSILSLIVAFVWIGYSGLSIEISWIVRVVLMCLIGCDVYLLVSNYRGAFD